MNFWYNDPLIAILISITLVLIFLGYNFINWQKRKKKNLTSESNLKQFYLDFVVLIVTFLLLIIPLLLLLL